MLVSTCTHRNWECRDRFSKRVWFVVTSKSLSIILLSYSVSDIKDAIRDGEMAETEIETLFLRQGRGKNPTKDLSKMPTKALHCCSFLLLSMCVTASQLNRHGTGHRVIARRGRRWTWPFIPFISLVGCPCTNWHSSSILSPVSPVLSCTAFQWRDALHEDSLNQIHKTNGACAIMCSCHCSLRSNRGLGCQCLLFRPFSGALCCVSPMLCDFLCLPDLIASLFRAWEWNG